MSTFTSIMNNTSSQTLIGAPLKSTLKIVLKNVPMPEYRGRWKNSAIVSIHNVSPKTKASRMHATDTIDE